MPEEPKIPIWFEVGRRIRQLLAVRGLTGRQLAELMKVHETTVSKWLNGEQGIRGKNLLGVATILDATEEWILFGEPNAGLPWQPLNVREEAPPYYGDEELRPGYVASPAEQLLEFLSQRLGHRRVAGELTDKDLIAAAYTLARKHGFTAEDYRILDSWRDQIIQIEKS